MFTSLSHLSCLLSAAITYSFFEGCLKKKDMKKIRKYSRAASLLLAPLLLVSMVACSSQDVKAETADIVATTEATDNKQSIMLALLLDTSNSMDGLIEQAKSQLWTIVNELAEAKCADGTAPDIKIALYEYGNDNLSMQEGYIRMVSPLTDDLDEISGKLFSLKTKGGAEFCGHVIQTSLNQLNWSTSDADLKMIFIAGNEGFDQGGVSYKMACRVANEQDVVVNTIFCGNYNEGIRTHWKDGAQLTDGNYMSIEQDKKTVYVATPYDDRIDQLNIDLNNTYIYYGSQGRSKKAAQEREDNNASSYSQANKVKRIVSKSSGVYKTHSWDLVAADKKGNINFNEIEDSTLPEEIQGKTVAEKEAFVAEKAKERETIQKEIQSLNVQRQSFIKENKPKTEEATLDEALISSIKEKAKGKRIVFEKK